MAGSVDPGSVRPLILTLRLDTESAAYFTSLRERYFPSHLNYLQAHVTLFHNLPGHELDLLASALRDECYDEPAMAVRVEALRSLGRGVAFSVASASLQSFRERLRLRWNSYLKRQDSQPFRPHITVQNKVTAKEAAVLMAILQGNFRPSVVTGLGVDLWWYEGGPWRHAGFFPFAVSS